MILHCNGDLDEMAQVAGEAGMFTHAAQSRADAALKWRKSPDSVDVLALEDEFVHLIGGRKDD
ncbi:MAG: hypothetical protein COB39_11585 [Marinosulfonomonas sp.]|nr:MAG: hypothetical protein COB39_11585 [Marinosulfonomonas sp.]